MGVTFPNESPDYRVARNKLLQREVALRREMEAVAAEIRALPPGGRPDAYEQIEYQFYPTQAPASSRAE